MNDIIPDQQLLDWNRQGLVPGPHEDVQQLSLRANYCLHLKEHIRLDLQNFLPIAQEEIAPHEVLGPALHKIFQLYDSAPSWIPLFFSNFQLAFWHGGSAWIFQQGEESPPSAFFQLRRQFKDSRTYLGIYQREEIMVHEFCHVGRMGFEEPKFEEIIAYQCSASAWRRWLGPLVQSARESAFFVLLLFLILVLDLATFFWRDASLFQMMQWTKLLPLGLLGLALGRLWRRQRQFSHCLKTLQETVQDLSKARAILYRLTDREILLFGRFTPSEIKAYAKDELSLRWKLIKLAYF